MWARKILMCMNEHCLGRRKHFHTTSKLFYTSSSMEEKAL